jgi:hypothetical protein
MADRPSAYRFWKMRRNPNMMITRAMMISSSGRPIDLLESELLRSVRRSRWWRRGRGCRSAGWCRSTRGRCRRSRRGRWRGPWCRRARRSWFWWRRSRAAQHRPWPSLPNHGQNKSAKHERHRKAGGQLGEEGGAGSRAECGLAAAAAKRACHVAAFALLQQDNQQQHEADEHVESGDQIVKHWKT